MTDSDLVEILYSALDQEIGYLISTTSPEKLRQRFYRLQKKDPALAPLSFAPCPLSPGTHLLILKKESINAPRS